MTMSLSFVGIFAFRVRGGETSSPLISFSRSAGAGVLYGSTPGQHLVHRHAERVDVGGKHGLAMELLGRHVGRAADHGGAVRGDLDEARRAEVGDLQEPALGHQDVARPQIAMDDAVLMGVVEALQIWQV